MEEIKGRLEPFVFEDHILKLDIDKLNKEKLEKFDRGIFSRFRKEKRNEIIGWNKLSAERYSEQYTFMENFFNHIKSQNLSETYGISDSNRILPRFEILIKGEGIQTFDINGKPTFYYEDNDELRKKMKIPVSKNGDEFNLTIDAHPQIDFPIMGKIDVDYWFKAKMFLDKWSPRNEKERYEFTRDIDQIYESHIFSDLPPVNYFFGEPGRVFYRPGDAVCHQFFNFIFPGKRREKSEGFSLEGKIYINRAEFFYQGLIDSDGTFPFYLREDKGRNRKQRVKPKMPAVEPVLVY